MKQQSEISLPTNLPRKIKLTAPYFEFLRHVRQTGGDVWAEFKVQLRPKKEDDGKITLLNSTKKGIDWVIMEVGVLKGLQRFVKKYEEKGIALHGFEVEIANHRFHLVDSKPSGYEYEIMRMLSRLVATSLFEKQILEYESITSFFEIAKVTESKEQLHPLEIYLPLPKMHRKTLLLKDCWHIKLKEIKTQQTQFEIHLSPKYKKRRLNILQIEQQGKAIRWRTIFKMVEQLKAIKKQIYDSKVNLGGWNIVIISTYEWEKFPYALSVENELIWAILTLLHPKEHTEWREEN